MWEAFFAFHICIACREFFRCQVAQGAVRADLVVVDPPCFDGLSCIVQGQKPVFAQAFLAELAVERFDVAVLHRPSRRDEVERDLVFVSPLVQHLRGKLRSVVDDDPLRQVAPEPQPAPASGPRAAPAARCPLRWSASPACSVKRREAVDAFWTAYFATGREHAEIQFDGYRDLVRVLRSNRGAQSGSRPTLVVQDLPRLWSHESPRI